MFVSAGFKGDFTATPSICRHITLLKLNSTDLFAVSISLIKFLRGKEGVLRSLL